MSAPGRRSGILKGDEDPFTRIMPVGRSEAADRATLTQVVRGSESWV
jgi:hypothetical protein